MLQQDSMQQRPVTTARPPAHSAVKPSLALICLPRRYGWRLWAILVMLWVALWPTIPAHAQSAPPAPLVWEAQMAADYQALPFVPGEVIIGVTQEELSGAELAAELAAAVLLDGVAAVEALDLRGLDGTDGTTAISGWRLQVTPGAEWATIEHLADTPGILFAVPNWIAYAADAHSEQLQNPFIVNDRFYEERQWYLQRINASRAWALATTAIGAAAEAGIAAAVEGGAGVQPAAALVQVAIIDSGVDFSHPELAGRLLPGYNYLNPLTAPIDDYGHGTHIAGIIGALINNDRGISGLALNVQIDPRKVLNSGGGGSSTNIAAALRDAADNGAQIINLSLEIAAPSPVLQAAVQYAHAKGALLIGAAGNCRPNEPCPPPVRYPAAFPEVIAVAATTYFDARAFYSAVGPQVELAAPGGDSSQGLFSTWSRAAQICTGGLIEQDEGVYCNATGTSMAAGVVSGLAALIWNLRPDLEAEQIRAILRSTATPLNAGTTQVGAGRIDALAALLRALPSRLHTDELDLFSRVALGSQPFTLTVQIENPSSELLSWSINGGTASPWLSFAPPTSGTVSYGAPVQLSMVISPTTLLTGTYISSFWLVGDRNDGSTTLRPLTVRLNVYDPASNDTIYIPAVLGESTGSPHVPFNWETPTAEDRVYYGLTDASSISIGLPFTMTLKGRSYTNFRLFSDGYLLFPGSSTSLSATNRCLYNEIAPTMALFGWWADLDPSGSGRISTFQPAADRFVVEFLTVNAQSATTIAIAQLSFQMVLYADGRVGLNYLQTPPGTVGAAPRATVGMQTVDGRFLYQLACVTPTVRLGTLPHSNQSFLITPEELY